MIVAVLLFGAAAAFSQTYSFDVTWPNDECSCLDQGDSYYEIRYYIYDSQNDVMVISSTSERVDFGTYSINIEVPEVNAHCAQYLNPYYDVLCEVAIFCDSYTPPLGICSTGQWEDNGDCDDFANDDIGFDFLLFE